MNRSIDFFQDSLIYLFYGDTNWAIRLANSCRESIESFKATKTQSFTNPSGETKAQSFANIARQDVNSFGSIADENSHIELKINNEYLLIVPESIVKENVESIRLYFSAVDTIDISKLKTTLNQLTEFRSLRKLDLFLRSKDEDTILTASNLQTVMDPLRQVDSLTELNIKINILFYINQQLTFENFSNLTKLSVKCGWVLDNQEYYEMDILNTLGLHWVDKYPPILFQGLPNLKNLNMDISLPSRSFQIGIDFESLPELTSLEYNIQNELFYPTLDNTVQHLNLEKVGLIIHTGIENHLICKTIDNVPTVQESCEIYLVYKGPLDISEEIFVKAIQKFNNPMILFDDLNKEIVGCNGNQLNLKRPDNSVLGYLNIELSEKCQMFSIPDDFCLVKLDLDLSAMIENDRAPFNSLKDFQFKFSQLTQLRILSLFARNFNQPSKLTEILKSIFKSNCRLMQLNIQSPIGLNSTGSINDFPENPYIKKVSIDLCDLPIIEKLPNLEVLVLKSSHTYEDDVLNQLNNVVNRLSFRHISSLKLHDQYACSGAKDLFAKILKKCHHLKSFNIQIGNKGSYFFNDLDYDINPNVESVEIPFNLIGMLKFYPNVKHINFSPMCRLDQHFCTKFIQFIKFFNLNSIESILFSINLKTKQEYFAMQNMADFLNINILFVDQQNNVFL